MSSRIAGVCGIASQLTGLATVLVAALISPWFSWTESYISMLGIEGSVTVLFNSGLIVTGVLGLIFTSGLWRHLPSELLNWAGKAGVACLVLGSLSLSAMGIFPSTLEYPHNTASITFLFFIVLGFLLIGLTGVTKASKKWGWFSLCAGVLILALQPIPWPWSGGAIQQMLFCLPWSIWTVVVSTRLLMRNRASNIGSV
ncbi:MAG: DUF998 domain-containing protein [Dehalococcoidales bacterium]|nr:MAG: DUF998 domain-containing protein [Dehalococcoidales bacterium]